VEGAFTTRGTPLVGVFIVKIVGGEGGRESMPLRVGPLFGLVPWQPLSRGRGITTVQPARPWNVGFPMRIRWGLTPLKPHWTPD